MGQREGKNVGNDLQINQLESVLQTDEAKEVLGAALLTTTSAVGEGEVTVEDDNDAIIDGVLALNTADSSFQSDDIVRDEIEEDEGDGGGNASQELEPGTDQCSF